MSLGVLNNISAVYAENALNNTSNSLSKTLQQLSSGSKINSGADDAAGLSLVNGLQANQSALTQSQTNAQEGVGLLQVADGALSQVTSLLNRAVTLATEAANGTLNSTQDMAANQEYQSILAEINNIGATTTYNQQQVFGSVTNIYTGDSSSQGSSLNSLNIRSLSSSNVGDSQGAMSYSNGQNNVFVDLSNGGVNASVNDSLGASTATTTIAVNYLTKGANGSAVVASANISVGAGTSYANTVQGLIGAINNSGLGLSATFGTAQQAGSAAVATAVSANDTNSALKTSALDTGIIISGTGVGVDSQASGNYTNGVGEIGTLTVNQASDKLSGTLNLTDSNGVSHAITLGTANSTDTLSNLLATINSSGYGITASINSTSTTNASGTHAAGTVLTMISGSSQTAVSGTGISDGASLTDITLGAADTSGGASGAIGYVPATLTVNASTDTVNGVINVTPAAATTTPPAVDLNLTGLTLSQIAANFNNSAGKTADWSTYGLSAQVNAAGTTLTWTETIAKGVGGQDPVIIAAAGSQLQDAAATTGSAVVAQTAVPAGNTTTSFGTITVNNANDSFTGGTIMINDSSAGATARTINLGVAGQTDNLTNLVNYINSTLGGGSATTKISAAINQAGTQLTLSTANGTAASIPMVYGENVTTSLSLTGVPTSATDNSTIMGTLSLPSGRGSSDGLGGTLTIGTETIQLGTSGKTDTMANLAQTINSSNLGITASLNSAGTAMVFSSADSKNSGVTPVVTATQDTSNGNANLVWSTANQGVTSSQYYSIGISGTVNDTSTGGGTGVQGMSFNRNGSSGVATISYSDAAGQSLAATDLLSQSDAQAALTALNKAIADVAAQDGYIGAQINTLNSVSSVISTQQQNVQAAQNAVQATDYAQAASNMSKYQILSQTGISALAQANSMQQEVLKLLQ